MFGMGDEKIINFLRHLLMYGNKKNAAVNPMSCLQLDITIYITSHWMMCMRVSQK